MGNSWNSDGFVYGFTDKGRVDFVFGGRVTRVDIEPITINISMFEGNLLTDISIISRHIISTEFIGWFISGFPRFHEER